MAEEDSIQSVSHAEDTASAPPVAQETSQDAPDQATDTNAAESSQADAVSQPQDPSTSKTPQPPQPTDGQPPADDLAARYKTMEERYRNLQSHRDREIGKYRKQVSELETFKRQQEEAAQRQNLRPWQAKHPLHQQFQGVVQKANHIRQALANLPGNLPPEAQEAARNAIMAQMSPEEQGLMQSYQQEMQSFQREFFSDPAGSLQSIVGPLVQQGIQAYLSEQQARQQVARDFEDPALKPIIEKHGDEVQKMLEDGVPYQYATHTAKLYAEYQRMATELDGLRKSAGMATAQQQALKGRAAITPDVATAPKVDTYKLATQEAKKRGISTDSAQFFRLLADIESKTR
jgi:hypothetical protein